MIPWLDNNGLFPPVEQALRTPNGLLAAGGDLSVMRLLSAYQHGIFPWFEAGDPILWWSPDPRMVLIPGQFRVSRSLARTLRTAHYEIRVDTAFEAVMRGCAAPRKEQHGTWIHEAMISSYAELRQQGHAHSVEVWMEDKLVGGVYGVNIGRMFYAESMFSRIDNASKIALAHLDKQLARWQYGLIDCQMHTPHLASLGAHEIPRTEFIERVQELIQCAPVNNWQFDDNLFR